MLSKKTSVCDQQQCRQLSAITAARILVRLTTLVIMILLILWIMHALFEHRIVTQHPFCKQFSGIFICKQLCKKFYGKNVLRSHVLRPFCKQSHIMDKNRLYRSKNNRLYEYSNKIKINTLWSSADCAAIIVASIESWSSIILNFVNNKKNLEKTNLLGEWITNLVWEWRMINCLCT